MADMDIDCDGLQHGVGDDGRCKSSGDTQSHTSFEDTVAGYGQGVTGLNAFVHPYVVFGNVGTKSGYVNFDPTKKGVQPLSIIAVVCGDQMVSFHPARRENANDISFMVFGVTRMEMMETNP